MKKWWQLGDHKANNGMDVRGWRWHWGRRLQHLHVKLARLEPVAYGVSRAVKEVQGDLDVATLVSVLEEDRQVWLGSHGILDVAPRVIIDCEGSHVELPGKTPKVWGTSGEARWRSLPGEKSRGDDVRQLSLVIVKIDSREAERGRIGNIMTT